MIPGWILITSIVALLVILHFGKMKLRRWAWQRLYRDGPAVKTTGKIEDDWD